MSYGQSRPFDPHGEARAVLRSAIADFGTRVLANATLLEGICEDRMPELPREASLIATAARADVVGMLQQQAGGVGPDAAVRLTAGALADSRSLDPAACVWVVREFARALGYPVSDAAGAVAPAGAGVQQPAGRPPAGNEAPPIPTMPAHGAFSQPPVPAPGPAGWGGQGGNAGWGGQGGNAGWQQAPWPAPAPWAGAPGGPLIAGGSRPVRRGPGWPAWGLIGAVGTFILAIVIGVAGSGGTADSTATPATVVAGLLVMASMLAVPVFVIAAIVRWAARRRAAARPPGM